MNPSSRTSTAAGQKDSLRERHQKLLQQEPGLRTRNAAQRLGVSELALLETRLGSGVIRLHPEPRTLLRCLHRLGEVMALTRNEAVVHERHGRYDNLSFFQMGSPQMHNRETGLALNEDIDLRLFMWHWRHCLAVAEPSAHGDRLSLQFFDATGLALHKVYLTGASDSAAYARLVDTFTAVDQTPTTMFDEAPTPVQPRPDAELDAAGLEQAWRQLRDTHDFVPLLKRFGADRLQALRLVSDDLARELPGHAATRALEMARDTRCEIMVFVGNPGCLQIHSGHVSRLVQREHWYNVLDPRFNLHLDTQQLASTWVTRKPTVDGDVTAVEVFDRSGELILSLFGKRKPGFAELPAWRDIVSRLESA